MLSKSRTDFASSATTADKRVEPVLGVDGDEGVARLRDALADVARELGSERQVEHGDERDDREREEQREGARQAYRRALQEIIGDHAWCSRIPRTVWISSLP